MKSMKVRKLAALGVAAALAATPVAMAAVNTQNLPTNKSWYADSKIVIGANAKTSDVIAAAEVAAAIAGIAYEKAEISTGGIENAKVKLSIPSSSTVGGEGKVVDDVDFKVDEKEIGTGSDEISAESDDVSTLKSSEDVEYGMKSGSWSDETFQETTKVVLGNVDVENHKGELRAKVDDYPAFVTEIEDLEFEYSDEDVTYEDKEDFRKIYFDIAGKKFKLTRVDIDYDTDTPDVEDVTVELSASTDEVKVYLDEEVEIGDGYQLKLLDTDEDGTEVLVEITKPDGSKFTEQLDDTATDFDGRLPFDISLSSCFKGSSNVYAKIGVQSETYTFNNVDLSGTGTVTKTATVDYGNSDDGWKLKIELEKDSNDKVVRIKSFKLYYVGDDDDTYTGFGKGWKVGETIKIADSDYGVKFLGFKSATLKEGEIGDSITAYTADGDKYTTKLHFDNLTDVEVPDSGEDVTKTVSDFIDDEDLKVNIKNNSGTTVEVRIDSDLDGSIDVDDDAEKVFDLTSTNTKESKIVGFDVDGQKVYFKVTADLSSNGNEVDIYFDYAGTAAVSWNTAIIGSEFGNNDKITGITIGDVLNGSLDVSADNTSVTISDGTNNVAFDNSGGSTYNNGDVVEFYVYADGSDLTVTDNVNDVSGKVALKFTGTLDGIVDEGGGSPTDASITINAIEILNPEKIFSNPADDGAGEMFKVAYLDSDNSSDDYDYYYIVEPSATGGINGSIKLPVKTKSASGVDVLDKVGIGSKDAEWKDNGGNSENLDDGDNDFIYTEWGSEIKAYSNKLELKVPTDQRKLKFFLGMPEESTETEAVIKEAKKGDTVKVGNYDVNVVDITGVSSIQGTYYKNVVDVNPLGIAVLDNELELVEGSDNLIVVGGWAVNTVAADIAEKNENIKTELETKKKIVDMYSISGREVILVAGWTAEDTRSAARDLINHIVQRLR